MKSIAASFEDASAAIILIASVNAGFNELKDASSSTTKELQPDTLVDTLLSR
jgi:hypothetical protein